MTYEEQRENEKKAEKADHEKLAKALTLLDIKVGKSEENEYGYIDYSCLRANLGAHQSLFCRINDYRSKGKFNLNVSSGNALNDMSLYEYKRIEINVAKAKTVEQIANDIKKRILENPQFTENYVYIEKRIKEDQESKHNLAANKEFFAHSGLVFSDDRDKKTVRVWRDLGSGMGYLSIEADISQDFNYCQMKLRGLDRDTWEKVFEALKPIIEEN